jgi:hypothetical protein
VKETPYTRQARLLLRFLPLVAREKCFGLKGGTAINLFVRDMPRVSVDIDLAYLPVEPREVSLANINAALRRIAADPGRAMPGVKVDAGKPGGLLTRLWVREPDAMVKVEANEVLRGSVYPSREMELCPRAVKSFELTVVAPVLSFAGLYGGKICAALDRQHPRDLFDVKLLLDREGLTPEVRKAFVVYLASHPRPMHELIDPHRLDLRGVFENDFNGMTQEPVTYEELEGTRERLIKRLAKGLVKDEKRFLLSLKAGEPEWGLLGLGNIERLPALQWKLQNIRKMTKAKRDKMFEILKAKLG